MAKRIVLGLAVLMACGTMAFPQAGDGKASDDFRLLSGIHDSMAIVIRLVKLDPGDSADLSRSLAVIDSAAGCLKGASFGAGYQVILRAKGTGYWLGVKSLMTSDPELYRALQFVKRTANDDEMDSTLTAAGRSGLTSPVFELQENQLKESINQSREKLGRYQKKYGPNSARLNLAESAFNFFVFRNVALFRTGDDGPGPLEFIASYSTAYVTAYDAKAQKMAKDLPVVSAFELGLRYYFLGKGWGEEGFWNGIKRPGYVTAGLMTAGDTPGFLIWPLRGKQSYGVFASWGGLKAGYMGGNEHRIVLSRQFQIVPYLF